MEKQLNSGDSGRESRYEGGMQSLVRSLRAAFAILLVAIILMIAYFFTLGGYFSVEPQQAVIVLRFGKVQETFQTGGHWFLPYPVHRFVRVQTNQQFLDVDFAAAPVVGNKDKTSLVAGRDDYLLTGDANIVHSSWKLAYRVTDPARYYVRLCTPLKPVENGRVLDDDVVVDAEGFSGARGPRTLLRNLFRQAVISTTCSSRCDDILTGGIGAYREAVFQRFSQLVAAADCGITVDDVTLNRIYPPSHTKAAFDSVTAASNTGSMLRNQARTYRVETENDTQARRAELLAAANTYRRQAVARLRAESNYFKSISEEYRRNSDAVLTALYTSALSEAMRSPQEDRFILGSGDGHKQLRMLLNPETRKPAEQPDQESKEE